MRIAVCSDEILPLHTTLFQWLEEKGHTLVKFGALLSGEETSWVSPTEQAALSILDNTCHEGIFCCWTGTGACIVANKVPGIRAALCTERETIQGARIWNHANVLVLSNRLTSADNLPPLLEAWFSTHDVEGKGIKGVEELKKVDLQRR